MYCWHCHRQIKDGLKFCTYCGEAQEQETEQQPQQQDSSSQVEPLQQPISFCQYCGEQIEYGSMICPICGMPQEEETEQQSWQQDSSPQIEPVLQPVAVCQYCGEQIEYGSTFCPYCGMSQEQQTEVQPQQQQSPSLQSESVWQNVAFCQYCGEQIDFGSAFCPICGKPQELGSSSPQRDPLRTSKKEKRKSRKLWVVPLALILALAIVGGLAFGAWRFGLLEGLGLPASETPSVIQKIPFLSGVFSDDEQTSEDNASNAGIDTGNQDGSSSGNGSVVEEDDTNQDTGTVVDGDDESDLDDDQEEDLLDDSVPIRASLSEYSWDELSQIAQEIEACDTSGSATTIAQNYNLIQKNGRYPSVTKDFTTSDGKAIHMRLIGVWHDSAGTTSGKAGLTFLSDGIVQNYKMANSVYIVGGWEASSMRQWLNGSFRNTLPDELDSCLIPVYKLTNNAGETRTTSSVTETQDTIWLPSIVEICGPVDWTYSSAPENSDLYNSIFNMEGSQYPAFAQENIDNFNANSVLSLGGEWWMRSVAPARGKGRYVGKDGDPSYFGAANEDKGVVIGFCL